MDINVDLLQWSLNFLIKSSVGAATLANKSAIKDENISNKELADKSHKTSIRKFKKRKVRSTFIDNIWSADLADMQLISKFNKGVRFLLCLIDIYSKYARVIPLKDKKGITITNVFQKTLKESNCRDVKSKGRQSSKIWIDKGNKFYNRSMKSWLEEDDIEVYSTHNEGKSVIAERFIRTLKNKVYKYMTSISKNVCIGKLDDIVNKCSNTYHRTIRMKPVDSSGKWSNLGQQKKKSKKNFL